MKIIKIKNIEGCLEGTNVKDVLYDKKVTQDFISYLSKLGKLIYNDSFEKPFYRIIVKGKYTLKGSETNKTSRVILPEEADGEYIQELKDYIKHYEK